MNNKIEFWEALQELNELTTILSIECPKYEERISKLKRSLTKCIKEELESERKLANLERKFWTVRNN